MCSVAKDFPEVGGEAWVFFLQLLAIIPLSHGGMDLILANIKDILSVLSASFLETPSGGVVEVKH